jgi:solute carrier family 31 (copper transporter), member 1
VLQSNTMNENETSASIKTKRTSPPFIPAHDVSRGILHIAQTTLGFFFMLTVM